MGRFVLTDAQWAKMESRCLASPVILGAAARTTGFLSRRCCGLSARAVPHGQSMARSAAFVRELEQRLHPLPRLGEADVWQRLFAAVSDEPDMEYAMVDATIVKVHRHGPGAKGGLRARPSAAPKAA